jgi:AcrR family transcriptional regulator
MVQVMENRSARRQDLLDRVSACVVHHHGIKGLTLQGVAEATGVSLWALRYGFDNVDRLFRAVVMSYVERILASLRYDRPAAAAVIDTIQDYARFLAEAMQSPAYRDFLYLVVRNGGDHDWLQAAYEGRVIRAIEREIEQLVLASGQSHGTTILLRAGAANRFVKRIESELVLPGLLPPFRTTLISDAGVAELVRSIGRELFEASYVFAWEPATAA